MKRMIYLLLILIFFVSSANTTIINIPSDYLTIQQGIDASVNGDTILVQPETYFENINFNGHNILLCSMYLPTGDTTHIYNTIIDGSSSGTVVTFNSGEDTTAVICGFTIQRGYHNYDHGGGIYCSDSSNPVISYNIIKANNVGWYGGGIYCTNSDPIIKANRIKSNTSKNLGGGIYLNSSNALIENNIISGNYALEEDPDDESGAGGGIYCSYSTPVISGNYINNNMALGQEEGGGAGIYCDYSDAIITENTITDNKAFGTDAEGGGIKCSRCNPTISYNDIIGNSSEYEGGGIDLYHADPDINNNNINDNSAFIGGGIACSNSEPTISYNTIDGDSAEWFGGGISLRMYSHADVNNNDIIDNYGDEGGGIGCDRSHPEISNNKINKNTAGWAGGIYINRDSYPQVTSNTITENYGRLGGGINCIDGGGTLKGNLISNNDCNFGGGIYCRPDSTFLLINNTIVENTAVYDGGGIRAIGSKTFIKNCIFWNNSADSVPEILADTIEVSYSDVKGGFEGRANIDTDPLFVGGDPYDFSLTSASSCINSGDSYTQRDPDSSITDMGAYHFNHVPPVVHIRMVPDSTEIVIPSTGGSFTFHGIMMSTVNYQASGDVWVMLTLPDSNSYGPLNLWYSIPVAPYEFIDYYPSVQNVPSYAPPGEYIFHVYCGIYPNYITDSDSFYFTKSEFISIATNVHDWNLSGWNVEGQSVEETTPSKTILSGCFPNPFNAVTTISFELSEATNTKLEIYNLIGQKVSTLINGYKPAGNQSVVWDASDYSSGIYFYKLTAGDISSTKRMTFLK
ncbi:MAG: T9SS type A sorting domain-containing protein [candidate division Zixibacteria bacterium]|nr:T9SS type A sorting domain-containing protein [candidate division Zixibacteria bacterium]